MGQPVAGVVTVTSVDGRQVARTKADGTVGYTASDLRPGTYRALPKFKDDDAETAVPVRLRIGPECVASERVGYGLLPTSMATRIRARVPMVFSLAGC
jgi:hypothetical protein